MPMSLDPESKVHPMKKIGINKVVVNIGVGKSGEPLERAKHGLEELTGQQPTTKRAKKSVRDFGIHKGEPIAAVVTLRHDASISFLRRVIAAKGNNLKSSSFDDFGNISLGIHEHIDLPDTKYNPDIGIFGMDVSIALTRPGNSIAKRRNPKIIGQRHRVTRTEAIQFFREQFGVNVV
jgi:large subunit ribosomal protein L5